MNERAGSGKAYVPTECEHVANICTHGVCVGSLSSCEHMHMYQVVDGDCEIVHNFIGALCLSLPNPLPVKVH